LTGCAAGVLGEADATKELGDGDGGDGYLVVVFDCPVLRSSSGPRRRGTSCRAAGGSRSKLDLNQLWNEVISAAKP
jgi:hypothetical protein